MLSIIQAAGWPIWTLIIASILSLTIILERLYSLRKSLIIPSHLFNDTLNSLKKSAATPDFLKKLYAHSPLGRLFAKALTQQKSSREVIKEVIDEETSLISIDLEQYLTTLGTIAAMAPLMGLLGTVFGMIELFAVQDAASSDPTLLAKGISVALYNTAFGLIVALPSMIFYRHFRNKVDILLIEAETKAMNLIEMIRGERFAEPSME